MGAIIGAMVSANLDPNRVLRLHAAFSRQDGAAGAHDFRQMVVRLGMARLLRNCAMEARRRGRARVQERGAGWGVPVASILFDKNAVDGEKIAEDPDAAFRCRTVAGDGSDVSRSFTHGPEDIEIDRCF